VIGLNRSPWCNYCRLIDTRQLPTYATQIGIFLTAASFRIEAVEPFPLRPNNNLAPPVCGAAQKFDVPSVKVTTREFALQRQGNGLINR
jgi:hypothetical protein